MPGKYAIPPITELVLYSELLRDLPQGSGEVASTYIPDNAWHSRPFPFHFSAHLLPLFDHWVKPSTSLSVLT